jgi:hypothetical protein
MASYSAATARRLPPRRRFKMLEDGNSRCSGPGPQNLAPLYEAAVLAVAEFRQGGPL